MSEARDFVREFIFQRSPIRREGDSVHAEIAYDRYTEGWVDIPHGGFGMGALADLLGVLANEEDRQAPRPPWAARFRMGGAPARVGQRARATVVKSENGYAGEIRVADS